MVVHTHQCLKCGKKRFPQELYAHERTHDAHIGVRFGDRDYRKRLTIDGVLIENCFEAMLGQWAAVYSTGDDGHVHTCCSAMRACVEILRGDVQECPETND